MLFLHAGSPDYLYKMFVCLLEVHAAQMSNVLAALLKQRL